MSGRHVVLEVPRRSFWHVGDAEPATVYRFGRALVFAIHFAEVSLNRLPVDDELMAGVRDMIPGQPDDTLQIDRIRILHEPERDGVTARDRCSWLRTQHRNAIS